VKVSGQIAAHRCFARAHEADEADQAHWFRVGQGEIHIVVARSFPLTAS
jgi:hypothetical protein